MHTIHTNGNRAQREQQHEDLSIAPHSEKFRLLLWNDDINTFDFVIDSLIEICGHTPEQAEQCTILVHYKGKCTVKQGAIEILEPMYQKLSARGLTVEIF